MKPFFLACLILASLFAAGAMNTRTVSAIGGTVSEALEQSYAAAQEEQWAQAADALSRADETWHSHEAYLHMVLQHSEIDETEAQLEALEQYARQRDSARYCTEAALLQTQLAHLTEAQQLNLKNIL